MVLQSPSEFELTEEHLARLTASVHEIVSRRKWKCADLFPGWETRDFVMDLILTLLPRKDAGKIIGDSRNFVSEFKRFFMKKINSERYHLFTSLSAALRELEKDGAAIRRGLSGKIRSTTSWTLADNTDKTGSNSNYTARRESIGKFYPQQLNSDVRHARIVSPTTAKKLVVALLKAFGGWTTVHDLHLAASNHVCHQELNSKEKGFSDQDGKTSDPLEKIESRKFTEEIPFYDLDAQDIAGRIWGKTVMISRGRNPQVSGGQILCLYWLPKEIFQQEAKLEQFGNPSTVGEVKDEVESIFRKEISALEWLDETTKLLLKQIIEFLNELCAENDYANGL